MEIFKKKKEEVCVHFRCHLPVIRNQREKVIAAVIIIAARNSVGSEHSTDFWKNVTLEASVNDLRITWNSESVICQEKYRN